MSGHLHKQMMLELFLAFVAATGCASGPKVLPSTTHAPSSPDSVKIYEKAPAEYEQLGTITLLSGPQYKWDEHGDANPAFEEMKKRAAAMGANGLLLQPLPGQATARVAAGYHSEFYQVPLNIDPPRSAVTQAIYVVKEK